MVRLFLYKKWRLKERYMITNPVKDIKENINKFLNIWFFLKIKHFNREKTIDIAKTVTVGQ